MLSVEEALATILARTHRLPSERIPLLESRGGILAEDITADIAIPPFDNSAVDGYAVQAADTEGARPTAPPLCLRMIGEVVAGELPTGAVTPGTAMRVMTGAPMPPGADAMVMVEDTRLDSEGMVTILEEAAQGQHIRHAGEDVKPGEVVLREGTRIRAAEIGMLATMGRAKVPVYRPARVAVISTGDEVVEIAEGVPPPPGKIRNSNLYALAALVQEAGAVVHSLTHIPDDLDATMEAFRACSAPHTGADVIVTAGGVSVGDRDYVKPVLDRLGHLDLWRVAMKPGKPLAFGRIDGTLFFGLPGNPVSAQVTFELFVRPALWKMAGRAETDLARPTVQAILTTDVSHTPGRREYVRAITTTQDGHFVTCPTGAQGSHLLHSMTQANSLLVIPAEATGLSAGTSATVLLLG